MRYQQIAYSISSLDRAWSTKEMWGGYSGMALVLSLFVGCGGGGSETIGALGVVSTTSASSMMPAVDASKIPSGILGSGVDRILATSEQPGASDGTGAFRTVCEYSHMNFDDPIVFPGQVGASHLHAFFGNTGTNANSTAASVATTGNSTCRGGTINRSAYWVPAMIDTRTGTPLKPSFSHFYYKTGYTIAPSNIQSFPQGLRMIAGNSKATQPGGTYDWSCVGGGADAMKGNSVQNCPAGSQLWNGIFFPQCWDGVNLDSPDHKSHMAYPSAGKCPVTHPVAGPEIAFIIIYEVVENNAPLSWRLSSDNYSASQPGGYSAHGDWFNGWKSEIMDTFVRNCLNTAKDCHSHLLGDGRAIDGP